MNDDILQQQMAYYRARSNEYDEWFYRMGRYDRGEVLNRQWFNEVRTVIDALHRLGPTGKILELAAGTGNWTQELLKIGQHITAVDASSEMIEINQRKVKAPNVNYQLVDLFAWEPDAIYDMVFFGFWMSHVPQGKLDRFLEQVNQSLCAGGKLFIVDSRFNPTATAKDHILEDNGDIYQQRKLKDGRQFTVIKIFYEPDKLQAKLEQHGFAATVHTTDNYFIYAQGTKRA